MLVGFFCKKNNLLPGNYLMHYNLIRAFFCCLVNEHIRKIHNVEVQAEV